MGGVELEAEVAGGMTPEEFGFAWLGLAIVGAKNGAEFVSVF